jgi:hypothetical protein
VALEISKINTAEAVLFHEFSWSRSGFLLKISLPSLSGFQYYFYFRSGTKAACDVGSFYTRSKAQFDLMVKGSAPRSRAEILNLMP